MIGKVKVLMLKGEKGDTGATGDYSGILNKPQINGVELDGNKTAADLGLGTASDQQDLIDTVSSLTADVSNINDGITEINGEIDELQTQAAGRPFIVTADINYSTMQLSNPGATTAEIYTAVHDNNRPVTIKADGGSGRVALAQCVYSAPTVAYFSYEYSAIVYFYMLSNNAFTLIYKTTDYMPFIVTADYNTSTGALTDFDHSAEVIWSAVRTFKRPCFLIASSGQVVAECVHVSYDYPTYMAIFSSSYAGNEQTWIVTDGVGGTSALYVNDFTQGIFSAANGVSATETLYRKGMVFTLNCRASGTFNSGSLTLGTYSGIDIDSNGITGACAIRTGSNGSNYDAVGTFTLAANGTLSVYYGGGSYTGVAINGSYIWPF